MSADTDTHVLVVDDNAATQYSTSRILQAAGYAVSTAGTGQDALTVVARARPDLVVLDINLPDIDGYEVCRVLRANPATRRIPVVYLSATFVDDIDKAHGVDAGADGYLTHPVESPVLLATVEALLRARRAEDAVAVSEARFQAIFEKALNGIALLSDDLIFVDANPALCRILGRSRETIVGRHLSAFSVKEQQAEIKALATTLQTSSEWRGTAPVLNAQGDHVELEWSVSTHTVPHLRLAIVSDITARVLVEADRERLLKSERQARAAAEEANRLKDDFLAALSHELRTPLNAIVGFARLLQLATSAGSDERISGYVNAIERNAGVQTQLISDLLDISRITSGKLQVDREWLNAGDAVRAALASIQSAARLKQVSIELAVDPEVEPIWWDPARFQQVVWNLVDNAVKFSETGGSVRVRLTQAATTVKLEVADKGRGISRDFLPYVFDRFRQQDATSRREHGGLGLGLAIVHQLVNAHGGAITATSGGEGQGSTFVVEIPLLPSPELAPVDAAPPSDVTVDLGQARILVVDDNDDARTLLRQLLSSASADVIDVSSAAGALEALTTFEPQLLLSDLAMPDQDGYDLVREIRGRGWSAARLPAIALSAFAGNEDRRRSLQAGFQAHFGKPPDMARLLFQISRLLQTRTGASGGA
jgi:PAS domain S-box-containing protein